MKKLVKIVVALLLITVVGIGIYARTIDHLSNRLGNSTDEFTIDVGMRLAGTEDGWVKELDAPAGSEVEMLLEYRNVSNKVQLGVSVWAELPEGLEYVENSTCLWNDRYNDGIVVAENTITDVGLNIGSYAGATDDNPGATATVLLTVKVPEDIPITTSLAPTFKVGTSDYMNTAETLIKVVKDNDPTRNIMQRPADYTDDAATSTPETETDTDTTSIPEGTI